MIKQVSRLIEKDLRERASSVGGSDNSMPGWWRNRGAVFFLARIWATKNLDATLLERVYVPLPYGRIMDSDPSLVERSRTLARDDYADGVDVLLRKDRLFHLRAA